MKNYSDLDTVLPSLRKEYRLSKLRDEDIDKNPIRQFEKWFEDALDAGVVNLIAMTVATASKHARPSARVLLLKGFNESGFVFYADYESQKGKELAANPYAEAVLYWSELERQVRISGFVEKISRESSVAYFNQRPLEARLAALASNQSEPVKDRRELESRFEQVKKRYEGKVTPCPESWGGYRLKPEWIEFWQGRPNRLNDRIRYSLQDDGSWKVQRIQP